jgi:hypothetical protein
MFDLSQVRNVHGQEKVSGVIARVLRYSSHRPFGRRPEFMASSFNENFGMFRVLLARIIEVSVEHDGIVLRESDLVKMFCRVSCAAHQFKVLVRTIHARADFFRVVHCAFAVRVQKVVSNLDPMNPVRYADRGTGI